MRKGCEGSRLRECGSSGVNGVEGVWKVEDERG